MRASILTLDNTIDLLPSVVRGRYGRATFGVSKGNAVLADIEKACTMDYYKKEYPLIVLDGITDYTIDSGIRLIRGLYQVPAGDVVPDYDNPISFQLRGNDIRLETIPVVDDEDDISGTVTAAVGTAKDRFEDTVNLDVTDNSLKGGLCVYTDDSLSATYNRIVAGNDEDDTVCLLNGELPEVPTTSDTYNIYLNYFLIDAVRYITRLSGIASVIDVPTDLEELFVSGLRYYYEKQTDQSSSQTKEAGSEYARLLKSFVIDENRKVGAYPKPVPRSIPDLNYHGEDFTNTHDI